jgi:hypothetical protein
VIDARRGEALALGEGTQVEGLGGVLDGHVILVCKANGATAVAGLHGKIPGVFTASGAMKW